MPKEIERKFLIKSELWKKFAQKHNIKYTSLKQMYISNSEWGVVRLRQAGDKAYLTIKTRTDTIVRDEFEYEIPLEDAQELFKTLTHTSCIEKKRYFVEYKGHTWDVDEFEGVNSGLIVAEIELQREDEAFEIPEWVGEEVTKIRKYFNSEMAKNTSEKG